MKTTLNVTVYKVAYVNEEQTLIELHRAEEDVTEQELKTLSNLSTYFDEESSVDECHHCGEDKEKHMGVLHVYELESDEIQVFTCEDCVIKMQNEDNNEEEVEMEKKVELNDVVEDVEVMEKDQADELEGKLKSAITKIKESMPRMFNELVECNTIEFTDKMYSSLVKRMMRTKDKNEKLSILELTGKINKLKEEGKEPNWAIKVFLFLRGMFVRLCKTLFKGIKIATVVVVSVVKIGAYTGKEVVTTTTCGVKSVCRGIKELVTSKEQKEFNEKMNECMEEM